MEVAIVEYDPSQQLIAAFPEFSKVRIFGTPDEPLFVLNDVQKMVGIENRNLERDGYQQGKHLTKVKLRSGNNKVTDANAFTERGLYRFLSRNDTDICQRFEEFVFVTINELRRKGKVTLEQIAKRLNDEVTTAKKEKEKLEKYNSNLLDQIDDEHNKANLLASRLEYLARKQLTSSVNDHVIQMRNSIGYTDPEEELKRYKQANMKPLYVYLSKPPPELKGLIDQSDETLEGEMYTFELSFDECDLKTLVVTTHVFRNTRLSKLHEYLCDRDIGVRNSKGDFYKNKYWATLDTLLEQIREFLYSGIA